MIMINLNPVAFYIGPMPVHWYGLMYAVGILAGSLVAWPYARARGITLDQMEQVVLYGVPAGLIGARLYYVLQQPLGPYLEEPWRILAFWQGGMAFYGAAFALVPYVIVLAWRMRISVWTIMDFGTLLAVVGQFFGRIGNIINGDIIGYPTTLPWGVVYANPDSFAPRHDIAYQPAAAYEAILNIVLFSLLWWLRNKVKPGMLFFTYVCGYSLGQIVVFFWRDNEIVLLGLKQAQITAAAVLVATGIVFAWFVRRSGGLRRTPGA